MDNYPPRSVVVTYDEDSQQLVLQLVDPAKLAPLLARTLKAPILLDEFDFKLDDEFARRFGGGRAQSDCTGSAGDQTIHDGHAAPNRQAVRRVTIRG
ncbi:hypothetical protein B0G76_3118 [Paraburkholderia sp. BL23I1N1]|nr:hypothetical protein B0G76_3118 [Paraburkholderia sp. BL23I1N1]